MSEVNKKGIALAVAGVVVIAAVAAVLLFVSVKIETTGAIVTNTADLKIYADSSLTAAVSEINWGEIPAGGNSTATIWVQNSGTVPLKLSMTYQNFNPPVAQNYITIQWNQQDTILGVGQAVPANFVLKVSPLVLDVTNFSLQLSINGVQN